MNLSLLNVHHIPPAQPLASLPFAVAEMARRLRRIVHENRRDTASSRVFVASGVVGYCGSEQPLCAVESSVGVNYELHKAIQHSSGNTSSSPCPCPNSPLQPEATTVLKGLLKGCAEQNALGSFAANGFRYCDVRHILLHSSHLTRICDHRCCGGLQSIVSLHMPCPECWGHLLHISEAVYRHEMSSRRVALHIVLPEWESLDHKGAKFVWDASFVAASASKGVVLPLINFVQ